MAFVLALAQTRLWFAGEATSKEDAYTVHGAYKTGGYCAALCCAALRFGCAGAVLQWVVMAGSIMFSLLPRKMDNNMSGRWWCGTCPPRAALPCAACDVPAAAAAVCRMHAAALPCMRRREGGSMLASHVAVSRR